MENPELRQISPKQFVMLDGQGVPDDVAAIATTLRRVVKALGSTSGLLEALWWSENGADMKSDDTGSWRWTLMIHPSIATNAEAFAKAIAKSQAEKPEPYLAKIRLDTYEEGQVVQVLYTGSLQDKQKRLEETLAFALTQGLKPMGKYHEIYLDDPGPDAPSNAKTILRQPVGA